MVDEGGDDHLPIVASKMGLQPLVLAGGVQLTQKYLPAWHEATLRFGEDSIEIGDMFKHQIADDQIE